MRRSLLPRGAPNTLLEGGPLVIQPPAPPPPRAVGTLTYIDLTGKLFPWLGVKPRFIAVQGSQDAYLPCFTSPSDLRAVMARAGLLFTSIKEIDDGRDFLQGLPRVVEGRQVRVILDLHWVDGRVRYTEVKWD